MPQQPESQESLRYTDVNGSNNSCNVTVFGLQRCDPCREAKAFLDAHDVAYRYITVDWQLPNTRHAIKQRLEQALGARPVYPAIEVNGTLHFGFEAEQWTRLLGLGNGS